MDKFVTHYNYVFDDDVHTETHGGSSMTVPDQSYSVREILQRFTTGIAPSISKQFYYESDQGDINFDSYNPTNQGNFDLADFTNMVHDIRSVQNDSKSSVSTTVESSSLSKEKEVEKTAPPNPVE